jgi:hypothetical protein
MTRIEAAAAAIAEICRKPEKKPVKRRGPKAETFAKLSEEAFELIGSKRWSELTPRHLVAQWCKLHEHFYGVPVYQEVDGKAGLAAIAMAKTLVEREFRGDYEKACAFMRWTWQRERGREKWRREMGRSGGRIGWRLQFSSTLVTDYRLDLARRSEMVACAS